MIKQSFLNLFFWFLSTLFCVHTFDIHSRNASIHYFLHKKMICNSNLYCFCFDVSRCFFLSNLEWFYFLCFFVCMYEDHDQLLVFVGYSYFGPRNFGLSEVPSVWLSVRSEDKPFVLSFVSVEKLTRKKKLVRNNSI